MPWTWPTLNLALFNLSVHVLSLSPTSKLYSPHSLLTSYNKKIPLPPSCTLGPNLLTFFSPPGTRRLACCSRRAHNFTPPEHDTWSRFYSWPRPIVVGTQRKLTPHLQACRSGGGWPSSRWWGRDLGRPRWGLHQHHPCHRRCHHAEPVNSPYTLRPPAPNSSSTDCAWLLIIISLWRGNACLCLHREHALPPSVDGASFHYTLTFIHCTHCSLHVLTHVYHIQKIIFIIIHIYTHITFLSRSIMEKRLPDVLPTPPFPMLLVRLEKGIFLLCTCMLGGNWMHAWNSSYEVMVAKRVSDFVCLEGLIVLKYTELI